MFSTVARPSSDLDRAEASAEGRILLPALPPHIAGTPGRLRVLQVVRPVRVEYRQAALAPGLLASASEASLKFAQLCQSCLVLAQIGMEAWAKRLFSGY